MIAGTIKDNGDGTGHLMLGKVILRDVRFAQKPMDKKHSRKGWKYSIEVHRLREIERLIKYRFNGPVPDPEDTDDRDTCLDFVRAAAFSLSGQDMVEWCRVFAPWATEADLLPIVTAAKNRRRMMRADGVAGLLHVTMAERLALKLKTIGAADMTTAQRKKFMKGRKREMDRKRDEQKRRAAGAKDRASYVASSLSTAKPWEALKMSRAKWYRLGKPTGETSPSRIEVIGKSEEPVSRAQSSSSRLAQDHVAGRVANGDRGSGTVSPAGFQGAEPHGRRLVPMSAVVGTSALKVPSPPHSGREAA